MNLESHIPKNLTDSLLCAKHLRTAFLSSINLAAMLALCDADLRGCEHTPLSQPRQEDSSQVLCKVLGCFLKTTKFNHSFLSQMFEG